MNGPANAGDLEVVPETHIVRNHIALDVPVVADRHIDPARAAIDPVRLVLEVGNSQAANVGLDMTGKMLCCDHRFFDKWRDDIRCESGR
jgi:hypothetical protein